MATEEQLRVTIQTVADTAAVQRYSQAVKQVQEQARVVQRRTFSPEEEANLARFRALGQQTPQAEKAAQTTRAVGESARLSASELVRFGAAALGVGAGLSAFTFAGQLANDVISGVIQTTIQLDQAQRLNTITLGNQAAGFQQWAAGTGLVQRSLLEAGTAAQQFGRQIGLMPQQVQGLVQTSAQLAQTLGLDVGQTMTQLSAAMQGNGQAANALGLNLDDAYVAYTQLGGASAEVFRQLDPGTQATLRYRAALQQTADIVKTTPGPVQDLEKAQNKLNAEWERFSNAVGPKVIGTLADILTKTNDLIAAEAKGPHIDTVVAQRWQQLFDWAKEHNQPPFAPQPPPELAAGPPAGQGEAIVRLQDIKDARQAQQAASATRAAEQRTAAEAQQHAAQQAASDALDAALQNVIALTTERVRLQHEAVDLTAEQARIQLSMLPAQQQMAALQRDMTEQQIRARQAALPATEVAEDLRYMQQRATLIASNPYATPEARAAARGQLRGLARAGPGVELAALEAGRPVTLVGRAATRLDMQAQLQNLGMQGLLAPLQAASQQNQLLSAIVAANLQAAQQFKDQLQVQIPLTVNINNADGSQQVYNELIEANGQAQTPPVIQFSPLRRT